MLLVLLSTANRSAVQPEPEAAISHLLRLVRAPRDANGGIEASHSPAAAPAAGALHAHTTLRRHPSFLSAGVARDRRGRIQKPGSLDVNTFDDVDPEELDPDADAATPRVQYAFDTRDRERGMQLLRSLKSPEATEHAPPAPYGLGLNVHGHRPSLDSAHEDEEDYGRPLVRV